MDSNYVIQTYVIIYYEIILERAGTVRCMLSNKSDIPVVGFIFIMP